MEALRYDRAESSDAERVWRGQAEYVRQYARLLRALGIECATGAWGLTYTGQMYLRIARGARRHMSAADYADLKEGDEVEVLPSAYQADAFRGPGVVQDNGCVMFPGRQTVHFTAQRLAARKRH